jgi:spore coat protein CotH
VKRLSAILIILLLSCTLTGSGQDSFYSSNVIRDIRVHFNVADWKQVLDSIFLAEGDSGRLLGNVTIDGTILQNVGVRYKGYSSWNEDVVKNPFNIELDYRFPDRNYMGFTKLKLSNVIHDPSFVREVLAYEIARKYMPVPHAGYANLYINDTLIGLYTNVESVDKIFIGKHFSSNLDSFFKGEPDTLKYPFGENANLGYSHGADSSGYIPYYKIESDYGWNDLLNLIYILNEDSTKIETVLNVDQALWMHAFNYTVMNLDSYIAYSQNYYLYQDNNGRFNPIIWDLNMSFGSFRESDGSKNFLGVSIPKMKVLDPLEHLTFSISPRPLMTNLFKNDHYRKMYLAHMRTIMKENFENGEYYQRGKELQELVNTSVMADTNKFYSYGDFLLNLDTIVGGAGSMIKYPGLRDLEEARIIYLNGYKGYRGEPVISEITHKPDFPHQGEGTWFSAKIAGPTYVCLGYRNSRTGIFSKALMYDDGNHHDGLAGDSIFGAMVSVPGKVIQYYIYAENDSAGAFSPERAETEYYTLQPRPEPGDLVINEIAANNGGTSGSGWIEILNSTDEDLNLQGFSLTDNFTIPHNWIFPDTLIPARGYMVVGSLTSGMTLRSDVSLPVSGGELLFTDASGDGIDSVVYGEQVPGKTVGRYPNGYGAFSYMPPTSAMYNRVGTTPVSGFLLYPDPAKDHICFELENVNQQVFAEIYNSIGRRILAKQYIYSGKIIPVVTQSIDLTGFSNGLYFLKVSCGEMTETTKFVID